MDCLVNLVSDECHFAELGALNISQIRWVFAPFQRPTRLFVLEQLLLWLDYVQVSFYRPSHVFELTIVGPSKDVSFFG